MPDPRHKCSSISGFSWRCTYVDFATLFSFYLYIFKIMPVALYTEIERVRCAMVVVQLSIRTTCWSWLSRTERPITLSTWSTKAASQNSYWRMMPELIRSHSPTIRPPISFTGQITRSTSSSATHCSGEMTASYFTTVSDFSLIAHNKFITPPSTVNECQVNFGFLPC